MAKFMGWRNKFKERATDHRRGLLPKCIFYTAEGIDYEVHFHYPSVIVPWKPETAWVVHPGIEVQHLITSAEANWIGQTRPRTWMDVMAMIHRGNLR